MAKYTATFACGHTATVELFGKNSEREKELERLSYKLCYDCCNKQNADEAKALNLPALTGSPKQIAWAESLRMGFIRECDALIHECHDEYKKAVLKKTESKWWIDHRGQYFLSKLIAKVMQEEETQ